MPVLARTGREADRGGEPDARARLWPFDEVVEAWVDGRTTGCVRPRDRVLRVFIVDDDRDAADSSFALVRLWGHDVGVAYAGAAALDIAGADPPDVMLLDIAMPGMDGLSLARQLRRTTRFQDTLLVAITGYADEAHYRLCEGAFDYYLIKPVEPTTLQKLLMKERELRARRFDHVTPGCRVPRHRPGRRLPRLRGGWPTGHLKGRGSSSSSSSSSQCCPSRGAGTGGGPSGDDGPRLVA